MNRILTGTICILAPLALSIAWAQPKERTGEVGMPGTAQTPSPSGQIEGVKGEVLGVAATQEMLLKTDSGYLVVKFNDDQWKVGFSRGDEVAVWGERNLKDPFGTEVKATRIAIVKRAEKRPDPIGIKNIAEIQSMRFGDRPVITYGTVEEFRDNRIVLENNGNRIAVDLGTPHFRETMAYATGTKIIVVGILKISPKGKSIQAITVRLPEMMKIPGEPDTVESIAQVLKDRPIGKMVRVRGHVGMFVGNDNVTLLYDGKNVLAVYPSEKYLSLDVPAGQQAEAVGRFEMITYKEREVGALRDARIAPATVGREAEKAKEDLK